MHRVTISMPDQLSAYVDEQIAGGRYGNVSEYFRELVRRDQERRMSAATELRQLIDAAEASGVSALSGPEILDRAERKLRERQGS